MRDGEKMVMAVALPPHTMKCNGSRTVGTGDRDYYRVDPTKKERKLLPAL